MPPATTRERVTSETNEPDGGFGVDARFVVVWCGNADFTYNTDFAQVEADEAQVNLSRFNLFFPEKREFFLENQGMFAFGGAVASPLFGDLLYFSFTTLTSTGFGDAVPLLRYVRGLCVLEQLVGALFLAILIARLAGVYPPGRGDAGT